VPEIITVLNRQQVRSEKRRGQLGQINAYGVSIEAGTSACMHLLWKLKPLSQAVRDGIEEHIRGWLAKGMYDATSQQVLDLMFYPFRLLRRIDEQGKLSPRDFQRKLSQIIHKEFFTVSTNSSESLAIRLDDIKD
jgi:hypothetical protein